MFKKQLILTMLFASYSLLGQISPKLERFSATQKDGVVYLDWIMTAGSVCLGIVIERSEDSIVFTEIGSISGVCGNLTKSTQYTHTDEFPIKNKRLYYRLSYFGLGYSELAEIIVIDIGKDDYKVNPNPVIGSSKIHFYNPKGEAHELKLIDFTGHIIKQMSTQEDYFELNSEDLNAGYYQFTIYNKDFRNVINGKLLIIK